MDEREQVLADLLWYAQNWFELGKPRRLYQDVTQICQDYDPFCFERELAERIDQVGTGEFSLVDDVRSPEAFQFFVNAATFQGRLMLMRMSDATACFVVTATYLLRKL